MKKPTLCVPKALLQACAVGGIALCGWGGGVAQAQDTDFTQKLSGTWGGLRSKLFSEGIDFEVNDQNEYWGVPVGGSQPSNNYIGATTAALTLDLHTLTGLALGRLHVSAMDIRGRPFSNTPLYVFNQVSGIEADDNLRLYELWYNQSFWHERFDVLVGKLDLSHDFMSSDMAQNFLNASFSWPMLPDNNLYDQGPTSPLATPAVRIKYHPNAHWTVLAAVGDDNPIGAGFYNENDPWNQNQDPSGTRFHFGTGALLFFEMQYHRQDPVYEGTFKLGGYGDTGRFPEQGNAATTHKGNWALYGVADQVVAKLQGATRLGVFVRATGTAAADRNQIVYGLDAGVVLTAPFQRQNDAVGLGWGVGAPSGVLARAARRTGQMVQGNEYHFELTYQYQPYAWLLVQPDIQGIIAPSGGVPDNTGARVRNEAIFGLHSSVSF
ncbi:MAG: carbohydrate porin [Acetobacter orientalis]|uniref:carbohydrate porin n=1 Tax=Acetobacter orientalis TaxID=146474 RepID=UPI0039E8302A